MRTAISSFDHAFADAPVFKLVNSPSEARNAVRKVDALPAQQQLAAETLLAASRQFSEGARLGEDIRIGMNARLISLVSPERIRIDGPCAIRGVLRVEAEGALEINRFVYVGDETIISARAGVTIGEATLLAHGVQIFDNNSHPTNAFQREVQFRRMLGDKTVSAPMEIGAAPVIIGKRCWIGMSSIVLKGVEIGDDTIVAAGSIVSQSLPAGAVAAGNPATVVRMLTEDERRG